MISRELLFDFLKCNLILLMRELKLSFSGGSFIILICLFLLLHTQFMSQQRIFSQALSPFIFIFFVA